MTEVYIITLTPCIKIMSGRYWLFQDLPGSNLSAKPKASESA